MTTHDSVECADCGAARQPARSDGSRDPCTRCGGTAITYKVNVESVATATASVSVALVPGNQPIGWQARWQQVQRDVEAVTGTQHSECSGENIRDATARLYDLYVRAYHLKDHLKADRNVAVPDDDIEKAITSSSALSLCADLANADKHSVLNRKPRSGSAPRFRECRGESESGVEGWHLAVTIDHAHGVIEGTQLAEDIEAEWSRLLRGWGLV